MNNQISNFIKQIDEALANIRFGSTPVNLYDPIYYILGLGGKRIRPLLAVLAYRLYHQDISRVLRPALAVEVFHNFTLLHDDIMDNAPLRRSQPTVHHKWNDNIAILSGDVMLVKVYDLLLNAESKDLRDLIVRFNTCAAQVCEGQQLDMDFETRMDVSEEEYIKMIRLKTAVLLGFSLELGGLIAGASEQDIMHLRNYGIMMGIGFQLKDDLLDVYGDKELFGKKVGGDIISNKKTYLLIKALELAEGKVAKELKEWIRKEDFKEKEKVEAVTSIYDQIGIEAITKAQIDRYLDLGLSELDMVNVPEVHKENLRELTTYLINRKK